jgi:sugar (pentulose or hexulose) kinase
LKGAALWARVSLGEMTIEEAGSRAVVTDTFRPDGPDALVYRELFEQYRHLYAKLRKTQRGLSGLSFA